MPDATPAPVPPPRPATRAGRVTPPGSETAPPPWAHLPADRQRQLSDLLGQLLARLHAARRAGEGGDE